MIWLGVLWLLSCNGVVVLTTDTVPCTDYDFVDPGRSRLETEQQEGDIRIFRSNVVAGCDDVFNPQVEADGHNIMVWEFWEQRTTDDCSTCLEPSVIMEAPPTGAYHLVWYNGDTNDEFGNLDIEVE